MPRQTFDKLRYQRNLTWARQEIAESVECAECGSKEHLEFDHINPEEKKFNVGACLSHGRDKLIPELKKCQLLCRKCHKEKSSGEGSFTKGWTNQQRLVHGSAWTYKHHKCRCVICVSAHGPKVSKHGPRKHGERRMYLRGCRCSLCRKANTAYASTLKGRKRPDTRV